MTETEALSLAIFAINTHMDPTASTPEDVDHLEANADEAVDRLAALREAHGDLPRTEDGDLNDSAIFGSLWLVEIIWNTDADGQWVDFEDDSNRTLHGPFFTEEEADYWLQESHPDDKDVKDMRTLVINAVRPSGRAA